MWQTASQGCRWSLASPLQAVASVLAEQPGSTLQGLRLGSPPLLKLGPHPAPQPSYLQVVTNTGPAVSPPCVGICRGVRWLSQGGGELWVPALMGGTSRGER